MWVRRFLHPLLRAYRRRLLLGGDQTASHRLFRLGCPRWLEEFKNIEYWTNRSLNEWGGRGIGDINQVWQRFDGAVILRGWVMLWEGPPVRRLHLEFDSEIFDAVVTGLRRRDVWHRFPAEQSLFTGFYFLLSPSLNQLPARVTLVCPNPGSGSEVRFTFECPSLQEAPFRSEGIRALSEPSTVCAEETNVADVTAPLRRVQLDDTIGLLRLIYEAPLVEIIDEELFESYKKLIPLLMANEYSGLVKYCGQKKIHLGASVKV